MEILLPLFYGLLFLGIVRKINFFRIDGLKRWILPLMLLLKILAGIIFGLIYTYYYKSNTADSFKFFSDSKIMFDTLSHSPYDFFRMFTGFDGKAPELRHYYVTMESWLNTDVTYNDNKSMVRLNCLFRFFSLGIYNVHVILINFLSFTGLVALLKVFCKYIPGKKTIMLMLMFLLPSVLFWGSGLLKDSLLLAAFGIFIYQFHKIVTTGFSRKTFVILLVSLIALVFIKIYVIILIAPGLAAWVISKNYNANKTILTFSVIYTLFFIVAFNLYQVSSTFNIQSILYYKQRNFILYGTWNDASMIIIPYFEMSAKSLMKNAPAAFATTLWRPFITDVHHNPLVLMSALENIFISALILICILFFNKKVKMIIPLIILSVIFVTLIFVLIGITTPVLGAMVRYRVISLPMLMFILVYFTDMKKLEKLFLKSKGMKTFSES